MRLATTAALLMAATALSACVLTCDDNGQDWHWLDDQMNWLT